MNVLPWPGVLTSLISPPSSVRQLAADGEAEAGAAVLAARAGVGLLERLEDQRCFSAAMPMPVSLTSNGDGCLARTASTGDRSSSRRRRDCTRIDTWPCDVNLNAFDSRFLRICCRRFGSLVKRARQRVVELEHGTPGSSIRRRDGTCVRRCRAATANVISSASTVTVPDSIFDRSRMSLISVSRSVPAEWMFLREIDLLADQVAGGVLGELLAEDEDRVERRAQLVRHVRQELGLVLRRERELGGLLFERAARLLDFLVLALDFDVLLGELLRLRRQLLVGLLQLGLPRLQLDGELLRLLQQVLGPHRRFDRVEHDADRLRELLEERQVRSA